MFGTCYILSHTVCDKIYCMMLNLFFPFFFFFKGSVTKWKFTVCQKKFWDPLPVKAENFFYVLKHVWNWSLKWTLHHLTFRQRPIHSQWWPKLTTSCLDRLIPKTDLSEQLIAPPHIMLLDYHVFIGQPACTMASVLISVTLDEQPPLAVPAFWHV